MRQAPPGRHISRPAAYHFETSAAQPSTVRPQPLSVPLEMSVETNAEPAARLARQNAERVEEMVRVPLQEIDKSAWPRHVRPIAISETGGLGIDPDGRLYWNGKPVEIVGSCIDLTWGQFWLAVIVGAELTAADDVAGGPAERTMSKGLVPAETQVLTTF